MQRRVTMNCRRRCVDTYTSYKVANCCVLAVRCCVVQYSPSFFVLSKWICPALNQLVDYLDMATGSCFVQRSRTPIVNSIGITATECKAPDSIELPLERMPSALVAQAVLPAAAATPCPPLFTMPPCPPPPIHHATHP